MSTTRPDVQLAFICLVVEDMGRSLAFYEHLGFEFPPDAYGQWHVEVTLPGGLRIMWDKSSLLRRYAPDYNPSAQGRVMLAFQLESPAAVDVMFSKLTRLGYRGDRTPWDTPWGYRYAVVYDPDGNMVDIFSPRY